MHVTCTEHAHAVCLKREIWALAQMIDIPAIPATPLFVCPLYREVSMVSNGADLRAVSIYFCCFRKEKLKGMPIQVLALFQAAFLLRKESVFDNY